MLHKSVEFELHVTSTYYVGRKQKTAVIRDPHLNRQKGRKGNGSRRAYAFQPDLQSYLADESVGPGEVGALPVIQSWRMGRPPLWPSELTGRHWHLQSA